MHGFDAAGSPVFDDEYRTDEELQILRDVRNGTILFAQEYFAHWHEPGDIVSPEFLDSIMPYLDMCDTDRMTLVDDLTGHRLTKQIDMSTIDADGHNELPNKNVRQAVASAVQSDSER